MTQTHSLLGRNDLTRGTQVRVRATNEPVVFLGYETRHGEAGALVDSTVRGEIWVALVALRPYAWTDAEIAAQDAAAEIGADRRDAR